MRRNILFIISLTFLFLFIPKVIYADCPSCEAKTCEKYGARCKKEGCHNADIPICEPKCGPRSVFCDTPNAVECTVKCKPCGNSKRCCYPGPSPTPGTPTTPSVPTNPPSPTNTPTPSATPTATPTFTPTPTPACYCDDLEMSGDINPGGVVTFTTYANTETNTRVVDMTYQICSDCASAEECSESNIIANSGPIAAIEISSTRYMTTWDWTIPEGDGTDVCYYIWADIRCAYKDEQANLPKIRSKSVVLGEETEKVSFFELLARSIRSFFGVNPKPTPVSEQTLDEESSQPKPLSEYEVTESLGKSPKIGTFWPSSISPVVNSETGCKSAKIQFDYP